MKQLSYNQNSNGSVLGFKWLCSFLRKFYKMGNKITAKQVSGKEFIFTAPRGVA